MVKNKRPKGAGSVYQRASDGMYCASVELPSNDGKRKRKVIVRKSKAEVQKALRELRLLMEKSDGGLPDSTKPLAEWLDTWFETIAVKELAPRTAANYRSQIKNHIKPVIGNVRLDKLTNSHIRRVHDTMTTGDNPLSSTSALYVHNILSSALAAAVNDGLIRVNPAARVKKPRKAASAITVLSAQDGVNVLRSVADDRLASLWATALLTGMRAGELIGLTIDRVTDIIDLSWQLQRFSWEHGCNPACGQKIAANCPDKKVTLPADSESYQLHGGLWMSRPKSEKGWRIIPLVDPLESILEQRINASASEPNPYGLVWTSNPKKNRHGDEQPLDGSPIDPAKVNRMWHDVLERAGVEDTRLHATRHTAASLLLAANVSETLIMQILGHSSFVTSQGYMNVNRQQLREAMKAMTAQLFLEPPTPNSGDK